MSDLRECPFCGKPPVLLSVTEESDSFVRRYEIRCDNCRISLSGEYESEAAELWDTRSALAQPEAVEPIPVAAIREFESSWDGLDCGCGGGWKVGHRAGCPEDTIPPITPDGERMRRALEYFVAGMKALSRADDGKESEGGPGKCPKCGAFSGDDWSQCKGGPCPMGGPNGLTKIKPRKVPTLQDQTCTKCDGAGRVEDESCPQCLGEGSYEEAVMVECVRPSDPTPPDATAQREAIARIIREHVDYFLSDTEGPLKAADAILALQPRAGG